jgi:hypothetical protein
MCEPPALEPQLAALLNALMATMPARHARMAKA